MSDRDEYIETLVRLMKETNARHHAELAQAKGDLATEKMCYADLFKRWETLRADYDKVEDALEWMFEHFNDGSERKDCHAWSHHSWRIVKERVIAAYRVRRKPPDEGTATQEPIAFRNNNPGRGCVYNDDRKSMRREKFQRKGDRSSFDYIGGRRRADRRKEAAP